MGIQFCPLEPAWGDIATWLGAIATFAAVIVALKTARDAGNVAFAIRADEKRMEAEQRAVVRHQLVIAFDQEIVILLGQFELMVGLLEQAAAQKEWPKVRIILEKYVPKTGFSILNRFASDLSVFPPGISGFLLAILTRWIAIQESPDAAILTPEGVPQAANVVGDTMRGFIADLKAVRRQIRPFALPGTVLPAIDD